VTHTPETAESPPVRRSKPRICACSLGFDLLSAGHGSLDEGNDCQSDEEQHGFRLCDRHIILHGGRIVDIHSQKLGGVDGLAAVHHGRTAVGQGQDDVELLEGIAQRQKQRDGEGRRDHRHDDLGQPLPPGGAVEAGGFEQIVRHILQRRVVDQHDVAGVLPGRRDGQRPDRQLRIDQEQVGLEPGRRERREDAVVDELPDVAQDDAADQVRKEESGAVDVAALELGGDQQRQAEGDDVHQHEVDDSEDQRDLRGIQEAGILEGVNVVDQADKLRRRLGNAVPVRKRIIDTLEKGYRDDEREGQDSRRQEQDVRQPVRLLFGIHCLFWLCH